MSNGVLKAYAAVLTGYVLFGVVVALRWQRELARGDRIRTLAHFYGDQQAR